MAVRVLFCGVRGSTPAPGPEFVRYGGHTSCLALAHDDEEPKLVLDAGTGLQRLTRHLDGRAFRGTIMVGHLHWDHTHGIPFFRAGELPNSRVSMLIPAQGDAEAVLERAMSPPHFPIRPSELMGHWSFAGIEEGERTVEGFSVTAREIPHGGGRTFGYRVSDGTSTIAYLSDHAPANLGPGPEGFGGYHAAALELARDVDVLIHDAQYTAAEFEARAGWGHSAIDYAVGLAKAAGARWLMLFHHDPSRTDEQIDEIVQSLADSPVPITAASEGMTLSL